MSSNVYCPLCGVILVPGSYDFTPLSPQSHVDWYAEARGIYRNQTGTLAITGLGIICHQNFLYAPLHSDETYVGLEVNALKKWRLCKSSRNRWCFGFHNSCWILLLLRVGCGPHSDFQNEMAIAESVFYQLYCTPCIGSSTFQLGHDYETATQIDMSTGRADLDSYRYADPCAIPSKDELEMSTFDFRNGPNTLPCLGRIDTSATRKNALELERHSNWRSRVSSLLKSNGDRNAASSSEHTRKETHNQLEVPEQKIFDKLSSELKFEILSYLSFGEVLSVRLVCRDLALLATIDMLPQSYWRSRFLLGQEMDFLLLDVTDKRDWYLLFFGARTLLKKGNLHLVNRKRIRRLLEPIAAIVGLKSVLQDRPCGAVVCPVQNQSSFYQLIDDKSAEKPSRLVEVASSFSGQLCSVGTDRPLDEGCRVIYQRMQSFEPLHQQSPRRIGISIVQIGSNKFISGLRIFPTRQCSPVGCLLGYHNPASKGWVEIPCTSHVKALNVAFCSQGLRGVNFITADSNPSGWIGVSKGPGIAYGTLSFPENTDRCFLLASFDYFKIVSLSIGTLTDLPGTSLELPSQVVAQPSFVHSHLWTPHVPKHKNLAFSTLLPALPFRIFEPLTNIDFGGPRGLLLTSLTRLTFHMALSPHMLIGIEIFYSDGICLLFGSNSGCEISLFVNGSKGERVNRVGIVKNPDKPDYPGGFQVSTNYGRTATFAPICYRLDTPVGLIPISPPGNTITGFFALEKRRNHLFSRPMRAIPTQVNSSFFERVGIQSQECGEEPMIPDDMDHGCHQISDGQLQQDKAFYHLISSVGDSNYQTYASLKNVRKIQASMGIQGRSRSPSRISGLKLDYYNHPSSGIVGQWMQELDDGFEMSPNEEVRSLTIWLIQAGRNFQSRRTREHQVARIRIETTHSRSATFCAPAFKTLQPKMLQHHEYRANSDEKLTAISWVLNLSSEYVRAVISARGSSKTRIMVPAIGSHFDPVRKIYFERQNDNGCTETIAVAEAYFKDAIIVGMNFIYSSGRTASMGNLDTKTRRRVHFAPGARIVGLSVTLVTIEAMLTGFEFQIERNQQPQYENLRLALGSLQEQVDGVESGWLEVWCKDMPSAESYQGRGRVHKPPSNSRLVGIYARCQEFPRIGALYELEDSRSV